MNWQSFAGNDEVKKQLTVLFSQDRLPHALLLTGPRGSGRRTLARLLARAAVCTDESVRPCERCRACLKSRDGKHPDITELGGDGTARSFHLDLIRTVREAAYVLPNEAPRRVFLLTEAQNMTDRAQNALLKVLEEPPAHALFLLTCESRSQLLPTIQSRVMCFSLGAVSPEEGLPFLRERFPEKSEAELSLALSVYGGILGQALSGLSEDSFHTIQTLSAEIAEAIPASQELPLLRLTQRFFRDKELLTGVLRHLSLLVRDALLCRYRPDGAALSSDPATAQRLSARLTVPQLTALLDQLEQLEQMQLHNMNPTLFVTVMCARLRAAAGH